MIHTASTTAQQMAFVSNALQRVAKVPENKGFHDEAAVTVKRVLTRFL
jgi:hypothetical protein